MKGVHPYIEHTLSKQKPGELVFPTDFRGQGTEDAIKKSLSRLAKTGELTRLAHGIYFIPKTDPLLGVIYPSAEEVAKMLAKKERVNIRPAGAYALNRLGLTTQVPTKLVYITDGPSRLIKVGKTTIKFKATSNKKLATKGKISSLLIQALEELKVKEIDEKMEMKILALLKKEIPRLLKHDLSLAPARVHDYIVKLLKKESNDRVAAINR
jgi:Family of unknown function (DUF6088)